MLLNAGKLIKLLLLAIIIICSSGMAFGGSYQLISVPTFELPLSAMSYYTRSNWASSDGKIVFFAGHNPVGYYLRDLNNQTTTKIDLPDLFCAALSGDGKSLFFVTSGGLHRYDIAETSYELVTSSNVALDYAAVLGEGIVTDFEGRYVAFIGRSFNMSDDKLFVHDMQTGQQTLEGVSEFGLVATGLDYSIRGMDMSSDGRFVAFGLIDSQDLGHGSAILFVRDRVEGTIDTLIEATGIPTAQGRFDMNNTSPISMSGDGRFIFGQAVDATTLIRQVVAFDRVTREFEVISETSDGVMGNEHSGGAVSNYDGSLVVFSSVATNLPGGLAWQGLYLKDRNTKELTLLSPPYYTSTSAPGLSDDGSAAYFYTEYPLVDEDTDGYRTDTYAFLLVDDLDGDGYTGDVDCNDNDFNINPGATEIPYNSYDENCNGMDDDDDLDNDGYGIDLDCDDSDPSLNPGVPEIPYNGFDENCSGMTDDDDLDQDSYVIAVDCDDNDDAINPGAPEIYYNGFDENCNGMTDDDDLDTDGYGISSDCNDNDLSINPGVLEMPYNGIDENCNGMLDDDDLDRDSYGIALDCDDNDDAINPGALEIYYNGLDENCNGMTDDDDLDNDGYGFFEDCNDNNSTMHPGAVEVKHDGIDQDCNGYDLTIDVTEAVYNVKRSLLTVTATSTLNDAASLEVLGFGLMTKKKNKPEWLYRFTGDNPGLVTVIGPEGYETVDVSVQLK